jgi:hypothetical protein
MKIAQNQELFYSLEHAMKHTEESAVDDFAIGLFRALRYTWGHRITRSHMDIQLLVCGELRHAKTDVCLLDCHQNNMLLVQESKRFPGGTVAQGNAEAQLIAEAIAAFGWNNCRRLKNNQPLLESQVCSRHLSDLRQHTGINIFKDCPWDSHVEHYANILQDTSYPTARSCC